MKAGTRVRHVRGCGWLPIGATGTVVDCAANLLNGHDVAVHWDASEPGWPSCVNRDEIEIADRLIIDDHYRY